MNKRIRMQSLQDPMIQYRNSKLEMCILRKWLLNIFFCDTEYFFYLEIYKSTPYTKQT